MITSATDENNWHTWKRLWLGQKSSTLQDLSRLYLWHTWMRWLRGTSWYFIIHNHNHWLCAIFKRWTSIVQLDPQVVENYWAAGATSRSLVIATFATLVCLQVGVRVALHMWRDRIFPYNIAIVRQWTLPEFAFTCVYVWSQIDSAGISDEDLQKWRKYAPQHIFQIISVPILKWAGNKHRSETNIAILRFGDKDRSKIIRWEIGVACQLFRWVSLIKIKQTNKYGKDREANTR